MPAKDVEAPDVLVDELIELVLAGRRLGALVEHGALTHCDGVALAVTSRPDRGA